jgi:RNA polymerase subunit RPABC4/transcription elongation factor Spt4
MGSVRFCPDCGGLIEKGFLFCPYCGKEVALRASVREIIDPSFKKMAQVAAETSLNRLDSCRRALDSMEKELDEFLFERL